MSSTPKEPSDTAASQASQAVPAPQPAPAPMDDKGLNLTVAAFVVFIVTWVGARSAGAAESSADLTGPDLGLLQVVLILVAGAAAVAVGRSLKSISRGVFIVITVVYFTLAALTSIFTDQFTSLDIESRFFAILRLVLYIADVVYPLVIAQVLAVTVSRVVTPPGDSDDAVAGLAARTARRGKTAAIVLFAAVAVVIVAWILRLPITTAPLLMNFGEILFAVAAAIGSVAAVYALRAVAVARSLPAPAPAVGPDPHRRRPRLAHVLTFLAIAGGLWFCLQYTLVAVEFGAALDLPYPSGPAGMLLFTIGSFVLAIVTVDAVTSRRSKPSRRPA